jgi:hypothetical protein
MFESDPTAVEASEIVFSGEVDLDIATVAKLQAFEAASIRAHSRDEGNDAAGEDTTYLDIQEPKQGEAENTELRSLENISTSVSLQKVSGRYRGNNGVWQLELRVDVDGRIPLRMISGDFYRVSGATTLYFGSFICRSVSITATTFAATITGVIQATFQTSFPRIRVTIPRLPVLSSAPNATIRFQTLNGMTGATYSCQFESTYFRSILLEEDRTEGVTAFQTYNTGSLPSGGSARDLSIVNAYREAGIEMQATGGGDVVPDMEAASDASRTWSDAELHASMERHFTQWRDEPGWFVWLLHANLHDLGPGLLGIMFDEQGRQRQGAAAFYAAQFGTSPENQRSQLYTCVHELGHCFNLFHSFQKEYMTPPQPNRPRALSYMNYPERFPGGEAAFWTAFPFQFDREELIHLRHAFRNYIIIGGADFGIGAALENTAGFRTPLRDDSGLRLELEANSSFLLGEPVSVVIRLSTTDQRRKRVNANLHPNFGFIQLAIEKPDGRISLYQPLINHCVEDRGLTLDSRRSAVETSAFIGYGRGGWYFDQTGRYKIRALYRAHDGSEVLSNILVLRVKGPKDEGEEEIADLFIGDQQGALLYLLGSDAQELQKGNVAFELVLDKYPNHPAAAYARIVKANNEAREFKLITEDNRLQVRSSNIEKANSLITGRVKGGKRKTLSAEGESSELTSRILSGARLKIEAAERGIPAMATTARTLGAPAERDALPANVSRFLLAQTHQLAREFVQASEAGEFPGGNGSEHPEDPGANR